MKELEGKTALITGASRGIGAATARELAKQGVSVILAARSVDDLEVLAADICEGGGNAQAIACDVSCYRDVDAAVTLCQTAFGRFDILVNNAGVIEPIARLADSDPDLWDNIVDINYKGVYHGLRAALPIMEAQGRGPVLLSTSARARRQVHWRGGVIIVRPKRPYCR